MNASDLRTAEVVGFFSLPSPSLAEYNPAAYNSAMADAPAGSGSCAFCGNGIRHHVVVIAGGRRAFIGTDCAARIGGTVGECVRQGVTSAKKAERDAYYARLSADRAEQERQHAELAASRKERFVDVISALQAQGTEFHRSLAEQLSHGSLSDRQARYALKAIFGRRNKRNAEFWDHMDSALTEQEEVAV